MKSKMTKKRKVKKSLDKQPMEINGMINMAKGLMNQFGMTLPEEINNLSPETLNNVLNNPDTKNTINTMVNKLKDCNNVNELMANLFKEFESAKSK